MEGRYYLNKILHLNELITRLSLFQMAITCDCPMSQPGPTLAATCGGGAFMLFMGLLEVFLRSQCDLEDPCGRAQVSINLDYFSSTMCTD